MNFKRGLKAIALFLIIVGIFIIIAQPFSTTGAVIDLSSAVSRIWFFVGLGMIAIGAVLLSLEKHVGYETEDLAEIMKNAGKDTIFVLDSSGSIDYGREIHYLVDHCKDRVYVPKSIIKELEKDPRGRILVENEFKDERGNLKVKQIDAKSNSKGYRKFARLAISTLKETKKHQDYKVMRKIIEDDRVPAGISDYELNEYMDKINYEVNSRLRDKYHLQPTKENQLWILNKEYKASKGDADVLVTALKNAAAGKKVEILAHDTHIRDAVQILVDKYPGLKEKLEYVGYREYAGKGAGEYAGVEVA